MNEESKLLTLRKERVAKTFQRKESDKVPFLLAADSYIPYYAGVELKEITTYDKAIEVVKKVADDLQYDCVYFPYLPQNLVLAPKLDLLGGGAHRVGENLIKQINPESVNILEPNEYTKLIKDPFNYLIESVFPRRFKLLASDNPEEKYAKLIQVYQEAINLGNYFSRAEEICDIVVLPNGPYYFNPIDLIFDLLRDFTGIVVDIKRRPDQLRDAGLAMVDGILKFMAFRKPVSYRALFCPMHLPPFIKPIDFEKVYWPSYKKLTEGLVAQGHNIVFYFEVDYSHLYDYLQDLPPNNITGIFEEDDLRVVKKKLGNTMTIAGGLSTNTLFFGTKQECIDMTKGLIDDLAPGGGFFIAPNTPLTFPNDAKMENLKAVADFINTYGIYK